MARHEWVGSFGFLVFGLVVERSYYVGCSGLRFPLVGIRSPVAGKSLVYCRGTLMAAYLCCVGWLEVYGMIVSVNVGFLKTPMLTLVGVLRMVMSR